MRVQSIRRRLSAYAHRRRGAEKKINLYALLRLILFLVMVVGVSFSFSGDYPYPARISALTASALFLYLMVLHDRCYRFVHKCETLLALLRDDLARAQYKLRDISDEHAIQFPKEHPFAHDLDLSAGFSLLKQVDDSFHHNTKAVLKDWIDRCPSAEEIRQRQAAVQDLGKRKRFRLKLALTARLDSRRELKAEDLTAWLDTPTPWTVSTPAYLLGRILALITLSSVILHFFFQIPLPLPWYVPFGIQVLVFYGLDLAHRRFYLTFMEHGKTVSATCAAVGLFETTKPKAPLLVALQQELNIQHRAAGARLKHLLYIHEMLQYRANGFAHFLLNSLLLWDQHYLRRLAAWRNSWGPALPGWIHCIFQLEAVSALANFHWLFPTRLFPQLIDSSAVHIEAEDLGHPTIPEETRVGNDYQLDGNGVLHLITGSNMSGKSTFLRAVALNLVLARMGLPVCARSLRCSLPQIWTSLKIQDNLEEGVSYFYAEVRRLKTILDQIHQDQTPILYMLDEILKGTNSHERLVACKALVRFLITKRASGLITTHDLELLAVRHAHPEAITNYHFQEQVRGEKMFFDYQLKPGELTSTNALRIMKLAGVPLDFAAESIGEPSDPPTDLEKKPEPA